MQRQDTTRLTKRLGKRLVYARGTESQDAFAARLGITRGYLSDLERGVREMSLATLAKVCKVTGLSSHTLTGL